MTGIGRLRVLSRVHGRARLGRTGVQIELDLLVGGIEKLELPSKAGVLGARGAGSEGRCWSRLLCGFLSRFPLVRGLGSLPCVTHIDALKACLAVAPDAVSEGTALWLKAGALPREGTQRGAGGLPGQAPKSPEASTRWHLTLKTKRCVVVILPCLAFH